MYDCIYWRRQRSTYLIVYFGEYKYNNQTERGKFSYSVLIFFILSNISPLLVRVLHLSLVTALTTSKPVISPRASVIRLRQWTASTTMMSPIRWSIPRIRQPRWTKKRLVCLFLFLSSIFFF